MITTLTSQLQSIADAPVDDDGVFERLVVADNIIKPAVLAAFEAGDKELAVAIDALFLSARAVLPPMQNRAIPETSLARAWKPLGPRHLDLYKVHVRGLIRVVNLWRKGRYPHNHYPRLNWPTPAEAMIMAILLGQEAPPRSELVRYAASDPAVTSFFGLAGIDVWDPAALLDELSLWMERRLFPLVFKKKDTRHKGHAWRVGLFFQSLEFRRGQMEGGTHWVYRAEEVMDEFPN